jgi:hypothetical protein
MRQTSAGEQGIHTTYSSDSVRQIEAYDIYISKFEQYHQPNDQHQLNQL